MTIAQAVVLGVMADSITAFTGGATGPWRIRSITPVVGQTLAGAAALTLQPLPQPGAQLPPSEWAVLGKAGHLRYTVREEQRQLAHYLTPTDVPRHNRAAFIPISKSEQWWTLAQDERRAIMAETSQHIAIGLPYTEFIYRKLYHCRDLMQAYDFITWFEFAPDSEGMFDELVGRLRATEEWQYVVRETDVRLERI